VSSVNGVIVRGVSASVSDINDVRGVNGVSVDVSVDVMNAHRHDR
jgi:hypothetical protein